MSNIIPFNYNSKQVRVIERDGEPWFVAKDIAEILEYSNPAKMYARIEEDEKTTIPYREDGSNYQTNIIIINESGLYEAILGSEKPEAKEFKKWVKREVLPSIRKHGAYMTPETLEQMIASPEFGIKLLTALKEEQQKRKEAEAKLEEQKPMVLFAESCIASNDSLLVREVAKLASKKGIIIGEKRLWQKLRDWGEVSPKNEPYQHAMDAGRWEIKQGTYNTPYGSETYRTPKVTPKGQIYIIEKLKREQESKSA